MATHSSVLSWRIPGTGNLLGCRRWGTQSQTRLKWISSSSSSSHPLHVTQQYRLASTAACLSSTGIAYHSLLSHITSVVLSTVKSSSRHEIAPQSLNSSSQPLCLLGDLCPRPGRVWQRQGLLFSFHLGCHRSTVSLSALMILLWLRQLPWCWGQTLVQCPHPLRAGPVLLTLLFFPLVPSSYQLSPGSGYSFLLVKYSCALSADVLHALLCLEVYSWCICGERCTPHPPIPLPSCSHLEI